MSDKHKINFAAFYTALNAKMNSKPPTKRQKTTNTASKTTKKQPDQNLNYTIYTIWEKIVGGLKGLYRIDQRSKKHLATISRLQNKIARREARMKALTDKIKKCQAQLLDYKDQQTTDEGKKQDAEKHFNIARNQFGDWEDKHSDLCSIVLDASINGNFKPIEDKVLWTNIKNALGALGTGEIDTKEQSYLEFVHWYVSLRRTHYVNDHGTQENNSNDDNNTNEEDNNDDEDSEDEDSSLDEDDVTDAYMTSQMHSHKH